MLLASGVISSAWATPGAEQYLSQPNAKSAAYIDTADLRQKGIIFLAQGELTKATAAFKHLVDIETRRASRSGNSEALADAYHALADCYVQAERYGDADQAYRRTIQFSRKIPKNRNLISDSLLGLAKIEQRKKRYSNAADFYKQALSFGDVSKHSDMAETWQQYAAVLEHLGKRDEAGVAKRNAEQHQNQCSK